jgi:hypothetical protein
MAGVVVALREGNSRRTLRLIVGKMVEWGDATSHVITRSVQKTIYYRIPQNKVY